MWVYTETWDGDWIININTGKKEVYGRTWMGTLYKGKKVIRFAANLYNNCVTDRYFPEHTYIIQSKFSADNVMFFYIVEKNKAIAQDGETKNWDDSNFSQKRYYNLWIGNTNTMAIVPISLILRQSSTKRLSSTTDNCVTFFLKVFSPLVNGIRMGIDGSWHVH